MSFLLVLSVKSCIEENSIVKIVNWEHHESQMESIFIASHYATNSQRLEIKATFLLIQLVCEHLRTSNCTTLYDLSNQNLYA